ncbi:MAG: dodecin domain-containing protein [Burkholderiales bacterium]|nr:dodecin domain-containing protein [Burkholderiales bacterium]
MSVAKIIEVSSTSAKSFQDAIENGLARASDSLQDVTGAWIQDQQVVVKQGKIVEYQVRMKVTFVLGSASKAAKRQGKSK